MGESAFTSEYPLNPLVKGWLEKIRLGQKFKKSHFQDFADESMKFFECGKALNDLMWSQSGARKGVTYNPDDEDLPAPKFRMVVGKVAELVELFGPALYHRNPVVVVEPKTLDVPIDLLMALIPPEQLQMAQMQAEQSGQQFDPQTLFPPDPAQGRNNMTAFLLNYFLDYIQRENDKKTHSRRMIDEALIKGAGVLWTETFQSYATGPTLIGSFYDTIDNLVVDPDAETIEESLWIARKCTHPVWQVAAEYNIDEDFLEKKYGNYESANAQGETYDNEDWDHKRKVGKSNDLIEYWKIYSRMGMGEKLSGVKDLDELLDLLDSMGDDCYIVVADKIPYPLNLKQSDVEELLTEPDEQAGEELRNKLFHQCQWSIPFWADGQWPCTICSFHDVPNNPWPMSHIRPALGYLKFINWTMSFLANKIRTSCRTVGAAMKGMETEIRDRLMSGKDFEIVEIPSSMLGGATSPDVSKIIQFLQMPEVNGDVWKVIEAIMDLFDKATGLTELAYGASGGMRSAEEARAKQGNMNVRPDDMANKVEDCMSLIARKEAMAARWLLEPNAILPILGQRGTQLWAQYVMSTDIDMVAREYNYRVEAGSTRKPNKETQQNNINQAIQMWLPFLQVELQRGNVQTPNAFVEAWCKAFDMDSKKFLLPPPPPPQPSPEMQKVQAQIQLMQQQGQQKQAESQMRMQEHQGKLQADLQKHEMDIAAKQREIQLDAQAKQQEMALDQQEMLMDAKASQIELGMKLRADQAMAQQKLELGKLDIASQALANKLKLQQEHESHKQRMQIQAKQASMKPKPAGGKK